MEKQTKIIAKADKYDKINKKVSGAISGALNPDSEEAEEKSIKAYENIRKYNGDIERIAKHTNYDVETIKKIKNYVFYEEHNLENGIKYFAPDYMMSESWNRLTTGQNIQPHDLILLKHELYEMELVKSGLSQQEAHDKANEKYNYKVEAEKFYGKHNKH